MDKQSPVIERISRRQTGVLAAIILGLIGPLLFSTWYTYGLERDARARASRAEIEYIADVLASGMREPVWNLVPESGRALLATILAYPRVIAVRVESNEQEAFLSGGDEAQYANDPNIAILHRDILHDGRPIGQVSVVFDSRLDMQGGAGPWPEIAAAMAIQLAVSAAIIYLLFRMFANMERHRANLSAHDAIRESEEKLRTIIENSPSAICLKDREGRFELGNRKHIEAFCSGMSDIVGKTTFDFFPEKEAQAATANDRKVIETKGVVTDERTVSTNLGLRDFLFTKFPILDENGDVARIGTIATDISEVKDAQEARRRSEQLLIDAVESLPIGFVLYDNENRLVVWNELIGEMQPWFRGEPRKGDRYEDILRKEMAEGWVTEAVGHEEAWIASRIAQLRKPLPVGQEYVLKDGRTILAIERKTSEGGTVAIRMDITDRKEAEERLRQAEKMEAIGQLTGGVAHDFNNLLMVISGNLELISEMLADDQEIRPLTEAAVRAAERGGSLTQQLLAFSRRQALRPTQLNLGQLMQDTYTLLRRTLGDDIEITVSTQDGLWDCKADASQLQNAILNLAINARQAMANGGQLTIETANVPCADDIVPTRKDGEASDFIVLTISDSGVGMPPEVVEQAFEPFFTTKGIGAGSGLGLSMVHGFVTQSGGHITIDSAVGRGTSVRLYLPAIRQAQAPTEAAGPDSPGRSTGETILVVDDNSEVRTVTARLCEELGYRTVKAEDGPSAIATLERHPEIDMLITDMVMPGGMSGLDLAKAAVRQDRELKVIFATGYGERAREIEHEFGADSVILAKPFKKAVLAEALRDASQFDGREREVRTL